MRFFLFFNLAIALCMAEEIIISQKFNSVGVCDIIKKSFLTNPYPKFLQDLECNVTLPKEVIPFNRHSIRSSRIYLCVGLLDAALRVCDMKTKLNDPQRKIVDEYFKNPTIKIINDSLLMAANMCDSYKDYSFHTEFHWLEPWVSNLNQFLSNKSNCTDLCMEDGKVVQFCGLIFAANKILHQYNYTSEPVTNPSQESGKPQNPIVQNSNEPARPIVKNLPVQLKAANQNDDNKKEANNESTDDKDFNNDEDINRFVIPSEGTDKKEMDSLETDTTIKTQKPQTPQTQSSNKIPTPKKEPTTINNDPHKAEKPASSEKNIISENTANIDDGYDGNIDYKGTDLAEDKRPPVDVDVQTIKKHNLNEVEEEDVPVSSVPWYLILLAICLIVYLFVSNKKRIVAYALEGGRPNRGNRRRPSTAKYRKLDSNLEEAITSGCSTSTSHVIY